MFLSGKVALVTGGSRGIGLAIASALVEAGARVMITARTAESAARGRASLERFGARAAAAQADVRDASQVDRMVAETVERFGRLDILVNNAGVGRFGPIAGMTIETWREVLDTNLSGAFHCCRAAIPHLKTSGGGWIINISSLAGKNPFAGGGAYCASKSALNAFSEVLMQEVRYDNIRVSQVMPGSVRTEFSGPVEGADWKLAPEDVAQVVLDLVAHDRRSLPSRVELRPSQPRKE